MIEKIISGGQTGVDRAALDVAFEYSVPCGGWCPNGRKAEDGVIDDKYPLQQTPSASYAQRTQWNVRDSDGTLILTIGSLSGGTALTRMFTERCKQPCVVVDLDVETSVRRVAEWLSENTIKELNVAGPRQSLKEGIHEKASLFLRQLLECDMDS